ncbi:MAG: YceI family protein [Planctomycetes bacterium]|nr:YceI family protein [Planctomycetota bacterium]
MSAFRTAALATVLVAASVHAEDTFAIDPVHSTALFRINHMGVSNFYGRFDDLSGTIAYNPADIGKTSISYSIKADSVDTHFEKRDQHLKGPDFFDAKKFDSITFKSTAVKAVDDKTMEVTGNLTLHGVTKPLTVKVVHVGDGKGQAGEQRIGFETTFDIKRSDFGMTFMPDMLGDEVSIILSTEGKK